MGHRLGQKLIGRGADAAASADVSPFIYVSIALKEGGIERPQIVGKKAQRIYVQRSFRAHLSVLGMYWDQDIGGQSCCCRFMPLRLSFLLGK